MRRGLLPVSEIFYSLQGEGLRTGAPSLFIRLSGCNLSCSFCDTDTKSYEELTIAEILFRLSKEKADCGWVVLTGGEPLIQDMDTLKKLLESLRLAGYLVQLETNGTRGTALDFDHITVSPKEDNIHPGLNRKKIKEVKELIKVGDKPRRYIEGVPHYLQPLDSGNITETNHNIEYCRKLAAAEPEKWRLSMQMHKVWGIR